MLTSTVYLQVLGFKVDDGYGMLVDSNWDSEESMHEGVLPELKRIQESILETSVLRPGRYSLVLAHLKLRRVEDQQQFDIPAYVVPELLSIPEASSGERPFTVKFEVVDLYRLAEAEQLGTNSSISFSCNDALCLTFQVWPGKDWYGLRTVLSG